MIGDHQPTWALDVLRLQRESTLRFIPVGCDVPRVLIYLFSLILHRHRSWLRIWSITITIMSAIEYLLPLKWSSTGEASVLWYVMSCWWSFILQCKGCLVLLTMYTKKIYSQHCSQQKAWKRPVWGRNVTLLVLVYKKKRAATDTSKHHTGSKKQSHWY